MCIGAFLTPTAYTLSGVMAVNGSSANGGCPSPCVGVVSGITTCDCGTHSTIGEDAITGVLIDNVTEIGTEPVWAAPLFTVRGSTDTVTLGFRFPASVVLREVELYLFHCPAWGIGAERIAIHNGASFPNFHQIRSNIGSLTLTGDQNHCTNLTRVHIPIDMAFFSTDYWIEFTNPSRAGLVEWVHIAEAKFHIHQLKVPSLSTGTTSSSTMVSPSTHQYIISVPAVVIVVLLWLLAVGGVLFLVCVLRLKASRRERGEGSHQEIAMKTNRAYCQVNVGRGERTPSSTGEVKEGTERIYETIEERGVATPL